MSDAIYAGISRWEPDTSAFRKALDVVASFPPGSPIFLSLSVEQDGEDSDPYLAFYATNRDYVFDANIPLGCADSPYLSDKKYFFRFPFIYSLVKLYPDFIFKFNQKGEMFFYNSNVSCQIRTSDPGTSDLPMPSYGDLERKLFPAPRQALTSARKMLDFAARLIDNKVQWYENKLGGQFTTYAFEFELPTPAPVAVQFRKYDMALMTALSVVGNTEYAISNGRFFFFSERCVLSFLMLQGRADQRPIVRRELIGKVELIISHLSKVLNFLKLDPQASVVVFSPTKAGTVAVRYDTLSTFHVGIGDFPMHGFSLRAEELRHIMAVFPEGMGTVECNVYGDGAEFKMVDGDVKYSFTLGRMDTSQTSQMSGTMQAIDRLKPHRDRDAEER